MSQSNQTHPSKDVATNGGGQSQNTHVPEGSTILVTGSAGFLGSAIVDQLLSQGFKVKAATRTASKLDELKKTSDKEYGPERLEVVEIKDLTIEGALDSALKDVSGCINVAADVSVGNDLHEVLKTATSLNQEVLKSVKAAGGVKSFVLTSSRVAAFDPDPKGTPQRIDDKDWFTEASDLAQKEQDYALRSSFNYSASKVAGEKCLWEFAEKEKPNFRVNSILPDFVLGKIHNPAKGNYSTATALKSFANGEQSFMDFVFLNPSWYISVEDVAKLHVIALLDETVSSQRIWAATGPYDAHQVQEILKEIKPDYKEKDLSKFPKAGDILIENKKSLELLKKHYGCGFTGLEEAVRANFS